MRVTAILASAAILTACSAEPAYDDDPDDARMQIAALQAQLETVEEAAAQVRSDADDLSQANDELQAQLDRFHYEDWRTVVGDAQAAGESVDSASDALESSVSQLDAEM